MAYVNQQALVGNLGADAEVKQIREDRFAVNFRLAASKKYSKDGTRQERTTWFHVKLYTSARGASFFRDTLVKGARVFVHGETLEDEVGQGEDKRYYRYILAEGVELLSSAAQVDTRETGNTHSESHRQGGVPPSSVDSFDTVDF